MGPWRSGHVTDGSRILEKGRVRRGARRYWRLYSRRAATDRCAQARRGARAHHWRHEGPSYFFAALRQHRQPRTVDKAGIMVTHGSSVELTNKGRAFTKRQMPY